jgi:hypothetical protein
VSGFDFCGWRGVGHEGDLDAPRNEKKILGATELGPNDRAGFSE